MNDKYYYYLVTLTSEPNIKWLNKTKKLAIAPNHMPSGICINGQYKEEKYIGYHFGKELSAKLISEEEAFEIML